MKKISPSIVLDKTFCSSVFATTLAFMSSAALSAVVDISSTPAGAGWINATLLNCCDSQTSRKRFDLGQFQAGEYSFNINYHDLPTDYEQHGYPNWSSKIFLVSSKNDAFLAKDALWEQSPYSDCSTPYPDEPHCVPEMWYLGEQFTTYSVNDVLASSYLTGNLISGAFSVNLEADIEYYLLVSDFDDYGHSGGSGFTITADAVAPVPVPAAGWLMGSGLLGLIAAGRRKS